MTRVTTRGLAAATALLGALGVAAGASAQTIGPLVRISGGTPFAGCTADQKASQSGTNFGASAIEPWIAVDPTRAGHLLTGVQQDRWSDGGARGLRAGVSVDGGRHWTNTVPQGISDCTGGRFQRSTDPWVAFGLDGTAYFNSLPFNNNPTPALNGESAIMVSRSADGGLTWQRPVAVIDDTDPLAFNDKNSMTADPIIAGNVYTVWDRLYGPANAFKAPGGSDEHGSAATLAGVAPDGADRVRNRIKSLRQAAQTGAALQEVFGPSYFARTIDSGRTWSRAVPIYDPGVDAQTIGNVIVVTPNGELLDFFDHITAFGDLSIDFVRSHDHGLSWTRKPATATKISGAGAVTPDTAQPIRSEDIIFSVTVDPNSGNLYVVWQDVPTAPGSQLSVMFTRSADDGVTWSAPVRVNQTPANATVPLRGQGYNGNVVVGSDGTLAVDYYDFRNDTGTAGHELTDAWVVFCTPGGATDCTKPADWGREARLTKAPFDILQAPLTGAGYFLGDYFGFAAQGKLLWPVFTAVVAPGKTSLFTRTIRLP